MKRAVVGARAHRALAQVWRHVRAFPPGTVVISGGAEGVDTVAELAARQAGLEVEVLRPVWDRPDGTYDPGAGFARNGQIVAASEAVDAFPWPGCRGTLDTMAKARAAGVPLLEVAPSVERPTLLVFSARVDYRGPGRLDITRAGARRDGGWGEAFAPSQEILDRALGARDRAEALRAEAAELAGRQLLLGEAVDEVRVRELRAACLRAEAERLEADAWAWYAPRYLAEMRVSFGAQPGPRWPAEARAAWQDAHARGVRPRPEAWRRLLALPLAVLVCFCASAERCHRHLLRGILAARGAVDGGDLA